MSRLFYHVMQDNLGNLLFGVSGTMRIAGTGTVATIYGDEALTVPIPNPMTNHPSFGSFKCFLGVGDYDFYMAKAGYAFETLTGVQGSGSMADQNANAVAILGGSVTGLDTLQSVNAGINATPSATVQLVINYVKASHYGLLVQPLDTDAGTGATMLFNNAAGVVVGSINTSPTTTTYATTSDGRLKEAVEPLPDALATVRRLDPVQFRWKSDGSLGHGLIAQAVQDVIPDGVITGDKDALDADGQVVPQMIDYSKLVPYLIGAVKELTQQVEMLQAKLAGA